MEHKDFAFVLLSLIIIYAAAYTEIMESTHHTADETVIDASDMIHDDHDHQQHHAKSSMHLVYEILSHLPAKPDTLSSSPVLQPDIRTTNSDDVDTHTHPHLHANVDNLDTNQNEAQFRIPSNGNAEQSNHYYHNSEIRINHNPPSPHHQQATVVPSSPPSPRAQRGKIHMSHTPQSAAAVILRQPQTPFYDTVSDDGPHRSHPYHHRSHSLSSSSSSTSDSWLTNASLLITTVDGKFSVLDAEGGHKRMGLDCSDRPLYHSPGVAYENQVIPDMTGKLFLLRKNERNDEYLEPLPFSIEQIAQNSGYADSFNTWYLVDAKTTVFWIDSHAWTICRPDAAGSGPGGIPDITDDDAGHDIPLCDDGGNGTGTGSDVLIVTRMDRHITAVDVESRRASQRQKWQFQHGEYRVAASSRSTRRHTDHEQQQPPILAAGDLQRYELWQSLDDDGHEYTLYLYDTERGEMKWSKSMSSVVTSVKFLSGSHEVHNYEVHYSRSGHEHEFGLWLLPVQHETQIAIARSPSGANVLSAAHMQTDLLEKPRIQLNDDDDDDDTDDDDDGIHIIDQDMYNDDITPSSIECNDNGVRFVPLSFDGDLDNVVKINNNNNNNMVLSPNARRDARDAYGHGNGGNGQPYYGDQQLLLPMYGSHTHRHSVDDNDDMYSYDAQMMFHSVLIAALIMVVSSSLLRRLFFGSAITKNGQTQVTQLQLDEMHMAMDGDIKVVGKFSYNVTQTLGAGRHCRVFCGEFEGRPVAIKRLDKNKADAVQREIETLLKVDTHPNIVTYFCKESDHEFDYIAIELCVCSLYDAIHDGGSGAEMEGVSQPIMDSVMQCTHRQKQHRRRQFVHTATQQMCAEMMCGVIALHNGHSTSGQRIIHRDLKPQNILIARDRNVLVCKLADMGMAKMMDAQRDSFDSDDCGTLFWNAPELIHQHSKSTLHIQTTTRTIATHEDDDDEEKMPALSSVFGVADADGDEVDKYNDDEYLSSRLTPKVDIFSLGCVFSYLLSRGAHPYGDHVLDQHANMAKHRANLWYCEQRVPEAYDLIAWMIAIDPTQRPTAQDCMQHPFFWRYDKTLQFLMDCSDCVEHCPKSHELRVTLECASSRVIGTDWSLFVDAEMLSDARKHRRYVFTSLRDFLRLIRNKWNHFGELNPRLQRKLSNLEQQKSAQKFVHYFTQFTPHMLMFCYKLIATYLQQHGKEDQQIMQSLKQYYSLSIPNYRIKAYREQVCVHRFRSWYQRQ